MKQIWLDIKYFILKKIVVNVVKGNVVSEMTQFYTVHLFILVFGAWLAYWCSGMVNSSELLVLTASSFGVVAGVVMATSALMVLVKETRR